MLYIVYFLLLPHTINYNRIVDNILVEFKVWETKGHSLFMTWRWGAEDLQGQGEIVHCYKCIATFVMMRLLL